MVERRPAEEPGSAAGGGSGLWSGGQWPKEEGGARPLREGGWATGGWQATEGRGAGLLGRGAERHAGVGVGGGLQRLD